MGQGMFHEIHNELPPTPMECASFIAQWINAHLGQSPAPLASTAKL